MVQLRTIDPTGPQTLGDSSCHTWELFRRRRHEDIPRSTVWHPRFEPYCTRYTAVPKWICCWNRLYIVVDPEKVRAITDMPAPETIGDLRRFLGMINNVGKFIPNLTTVLSLIKKDVLWTWSESQQSAFNMAKDLISRAPVSRLRPA